MRARFKKDFLIMRNIVVNNAEFDKNVSHLIDRISSFQSPRLQITIWDLVNGSYQHTILKDPSAFRVNLEDNQDSCNALYSFSKKLPDIYQKIYGAHKDAPIKITLEADLPSGILYTVVCMISPEYGLCNVTVDNKLRLESWHDKEIPRVFADFFLGNQIAA